MPKFSPRITTTILHGKYNYWRDHARDLLRRFNEKSSLIDKHITLPKNVEIRFRIIPKNLYASGIAYQPKTKRDKYLVDVDVRQTINSFFETLLHELVHIEQYYTKKLYIDGDNNSIWKGKQYSTVDDVFSNDYLKQPWEAEANKKANKIIKKLKL